MRDNIKVSIIVPFYNAEEYIARCVISLQHQVYKNFEVIFVDDGSTDSGAMLLNEYPDSRFKIFHCEKTGYPRLETSALSR